MDNERDLYDQPEDTTQTAERPTWEREIVPVEPDEASELEEVEGEEEGDAGEDAGEVVEGGELVEADEDEEASLALSDMQVAANEEMREAGLPDFDVDAYMAALRESGAGDLALAEEDMPMFTSYLDAQLEAGVGAAAIGAGVGWYLKMQAGAEQQGHDADLATRDRMIEELQANWGSKYQNNIFALKHLIGGMGPVGAAIQEARMPSGELLVNVPGFADTFLRIARSGTRPTPSPTARLAEINEVLATNSQRYFAEQLDKEAVKLRGRLEGAREEAEVRGDRQPATRREKEPTGAPPH